MQVRRVIVLVIAVAAATVGLSSCQTGRAGARCRTKEFGQDATNVLVCRNGRWQRSITTAQAAAFIIGVIKARQTTTTTTTTPAPAPLVETQVATGNSDTCALRSDHTVWCWGDNSSGQLGDGSTTERHQPVRVAGLATANQIAARSSQTCALLVDGTVSCWGNNFYGELGDGTTTNRSTPVRVLGVSGATQISLGNQSACALIAGGAIRCWGYNLYGQLGNGTTTNSVAPVPVSGISSAVEIALSPLPGGEGFLLPAAHPLAAEGHCLAFHSHILGNDGANEGAKDRFAARGPR